MNSLKKVILASAALVLAMMFGGCSDTEKSPSEITVGSSDASASTRQSGGLVFSSENFESPAAEEKKPSVDKVSLSAENRFLSSERRFAVDEENSAITLDVSYGNYVDIKTLHNCFLDIEVSNAGSKLDGVFNADGSIDLTQGATLTVTGEDGYFKEYSVAAERTVHDLPIVNIRLDGLSSPSSIQRDVEKKMEMYIDCTGDPSFPNTGIMTGTIRGRGHSTWEWAKKPYRIKLDNSSPLMGFTKNKDWILLANYADKSLIRNIVAYDMAREMEDLVWTPTQYSVDLFINGEYQGVYAIGEQREVAENRIDLDKSDDIDRGYLLEVGGADDKSMKEGYDYFHTNSGLVKYITFADPKAKKLSAEQRAFLINYVNKADDAIVNGGNYGEYIDVDSFVDWLIVQELTCNLDSCFRRSCFITKDKGGKLKMGPVWDFDHAFGNFDLDNENYDTWFCVGTEDGEDDNESDSDSESSGVAGTGEEAYIKVNWCNYLMEDEYFRERLKERWLEKRDALLKAAEDSISRNSQKLQASQRENFKIWANLGFKNGFQSWATANISTYDGQVEYLRDFIKKRAEWIDANI